MRRESYVAVQNEQRDRAVDCSRAARHDKGVAVQNERQNEHSDRKMCGIFGCLQKEGDISSFRTRALQLSKRLRHRFAPNLRNFKLKLIYQAEDLIGAAGK